jgi:YD repeat-containing protein
MITDNLNNGAYARWDYGSWVVTKSETIQDGAGENHTVTILDGFGRAVATGGDNPSSTGGSWAKWMFTDVMGRPSTGTNPTEINGAWVPIGDDAAGWLWSTPVIYDWKGRPRFTYDMDGTYKEASYGGCGCAGGEVVTLTDETGRRQRATSDPLGRQLKIEVLNLDSSVYSTTANIYNARDQVTAVNTYKGAATSDLSCPSGTCMQSVTTFDGYGRPATQKQPQQSAPTTYAYNADDTVQTVTDPRGVVATNTYNSRHLLTGVSYTTPTGIDAPSPVSFGYDGVGNRTAMADGTGAINYAYNQLSRMTSETRSFAGLTNSYTISYSYNLGGELTSVIDPSNAQVSYNYDSTGRLTSMPASGYTGVTNFLSNVQYRAFGGMKHATYGNSVQVDLTYNSRMQIGQYQASGFHDYYGAPYSMGATMSYYADGRTNTAFDLNDSKFDRKYEFDFSARLKEAYTGVEAHGQPPSQANGPYRQSYSYDEFNDVLSRSGKVWTNYEVENASYTSDNKHLYWGYDSAGNVLSTNDGEYTYDAAARPVTYTSGQWWQMYPNWPSNHPDAPALETIDTFDGSGQLAKHVSTTRTDQSWVDEWDNIHYLMSEGTATKYYVHSTALGGKTIAEVGSNGVIGDRFVYFGGARIATQHNYGYSTPAEIGMTNPVTGAAITTDANASYPARQEPDPLGRDLVTPPEQGLVSDPVSGVLKDRWMPIEYTGGQTDEVNIGMAIYLDAMQMVMAREAYKRWLNVDQSEKTKNAEYDTWTNILNKNPNVGIVAGKDTLWGKSAADFLKKNANAITLGPNGITLHQPPKPISDKPTTAGIVFTTAVIRDSVKDDAEITTADFTPNSDGSSYATTFEFGGDSKVCNGKPFSLSVRFRTGSSVNLRSPKDPRNRIDPGRDSQFKGEGALQAKSSEQPPQFLTRLVRQNPDNPGRTITVTAVGNDQFGPVSASAFVKINCP